MRLTRSREAWCTAAPHGRRNTTILQYWYFYYDDFYSYNYPPDDFIWQAHEGDWEAVTILVPRGSEHPRWVGYSQHCTGERRSWSDTPRWHGSTHPVVDVGIGSHANFFTSGDHPIAVQCIPPQAVAFLQSQGLALPDDHTHPGQAYGPAHAAGVTPTAVVRVRATRPAWMRFAGTWGEYQFFHGPNPISTVVSGLLPGLAAGPGAVAAPGADGSRLAAERLGGAYGSGSRVRAPAPVTRAGHRRWRCRRRSGIEYQSTVIDPSTAAEAVAATTEL